MTSREILLGVAEFLDSSAARALSIRVEEVRKVATEIVASAYEDLGKQPWRMDGEDATFLLTQALPGRFKRKDPLAEHIPAVLGAYLAHLQESQVVTQAYELTQGVEASLGPFLDLVRSGGNEPRATGSPSKPVVHQAAKLGRNDPCFCGSGKKFKKCHGKGA